jgi:hypothetical protein
MDISESTPVTMENFKTRVDLYLTEISLELLGNKIYDINGQRQDKLKELFVAPKVKENSDDAENSVDFLCSLEYDSNYTKHADSMLNFLEDQLDYLLSESNTTPAINRQIISFLRAYKSDQKQILKDSSEMHVKKLVERKRIVSMLNNSRQQAVNSVKSGAGKTRAVEGYYENERHQLLKTCTDTLRLLKRIVRDVDCEMSRAELIGFCHVMRSVRECEKNSKTGNHTIKKPYKMERRRKM